MLSHKVNMGVYLEDYGTVVCMVYARPDYVKVRLLCACTQCMSTLTSTTELQNKILLATFAYHAGCGLEGRLPHKDATPKCTPCKYTYAYYILSFKSLLVYQLKVLSNN